MFLSVKKLDSVIVMQVYFLLAGKGGGRGGGGVSSNDISSGSHVARCISSIKGDKTGSARLFGMRRNANSPRTQRAPRTARSNAWG